jgi:hypothetical protein
MKKFLSIILVAMLCGIAYSASAQKIAITGRVIDNTGEYIAGASVIEVGTTNGVVTDVNGLYTLSVSDTAIVKVSYLGYKTAQFNVIGAGFYLTILFPDQNGDIEKNSEEKW